MVVTRAHRVALSLFSGIAILSLVVWTTPRVLLMAVGVALVVLVYAAIYLVAIAWLDPRGPAAPARRDDETPPSPERHDAPVTEITPAPPARKRTPRKRKAGR